MHIIITGASRGIGRETALHMAQQGHRVYALARNAAALETLEKEQPQITGFAVDLADQSQLAGLAQKIKAQTQHIDILIHNAGFLANAGFEDTTLETLEKIYRVNVFAPYLLTQQFLPLLQKASRAHVIHIGSMGGFQGSAKFPGLSAYSSSKAALANLSECLAEEYKSSNIRFNCLALGAVQTEMLAEAFPGYQAPSNAAEMAAFIANFALHAPGVLNGKTIPVAQTIP